MILGGLKVGVSPLDMAHAYETFATGGKRVYNPELGAPDEGPIGNRRDPMPAHVCPHRPTLVDHPATSGSSRPDVASTIHEMLAGVVQTGTGTAAAIPGVGVAGKTGTTTNYADAWFVGWTPQLTTAVLGRLPQQARPMSTLYNGAPVEGGTFPAIIWHNFMVQALQDLANEQAAANGASGPHRLDRRHLGAGLDHPIHGAGADDHDERRRGRDAGPGRHRRDNGSRYDHAHNGSREPQHLDPARRCHRLPQRRRGRLTLRHG